MKRHDLIELLARRPIIHPTRIDGLTWRGRKLTIAVCGYRWWEQPYTDRSEGRLDLVFDNLADGQILTDEFDPRDDEALEYFEVRLVSEVPWAQACEWSIFCSGPVSKPLTLYSKVHDYLSIHGAFVAADRFLNQANDLSRFIDMARSNGFMIARGPRSIRDLVCAELERQSVPHNVLQTPDTTESKLLVRLGNSAFFCESALAEFADRISHDGRSRCLPPPAHAVRSRPMSHGRQAPRCGT